MQCGSWNQHIQRRRNKKKKEKHESRGENCRYCGKIELRMRRNCKYCTNTKLQVVAELSQGCRR